MAKIRGPQGKPEVNTQRSHQKVRSNFRVQKSKSLNLGPNASGPYQQSNPAEFFQPRKNSQVKPTSSNPNVTWVNLGTMGWVSHTKENPVWNMDGYCYLVAINDVGLKN